MAPPGTHVLVHDKAGNYTPWGHHGTPGWYIGPSLENYRCMQCYMPATGILRITYPPIYPKGIFFPKNNHRRWYIAGNWIHICNYKRPPEDNSFIVLWRWKKTRSIRLPTSCKESHLSHAYKFYHYYQCYHRLRVKYSTSKHPQHTSTSSEGKTGFATSKGAKTPVRTHTATKISDFNTPQAWIHIQINRLKNYNIFEDTPDSRSQENTSGNLAS